MEWIIKSRGEITRGISESPHYTSENDFLAALRVLFSDPKKQFVSATLPDGRVLDEAAAKGFTIGVSPIGQTPLG